MTDARQPLPTPIVETRLIAIARRVTREKVADIAKALVEAGVSVLEITLDGDDAFEQIELVTGSGLTVGAGTVMGVPAAEAAVARGAEFIVSPHTDQSIVAWGNESGIPVMAGAMTPTEIVAAWRAGATAVKVFPAASLGPGFITDLRGPLPEIPLIPTGGIDASNAGDYLAAGASAVGVGRWLTGGDPAQVLSRAEELVAVCA